MNEPRVIRTRAELVALADELRVRPDWHEPDEQEITAMFGGTPMHFDNAMGPGTEYGDGHSEMHVVLHRFDTDEYGDADLGEPIAVVNLATLFAWATGYEADVVDVDAGKAKQVRRVGVRYHEGSSVRMYAFDTDLPVKVGDEVLFPGRYGGSALGTVVMLDHEYDGAVKRIRAIVTAEEDEE